MNEKNFPLSDLFPENKRNKEILQWCTSVEGLSPLPIVCFRVPAETSYELLYKYWDTPTPRHCLYSPSWPYPFLLMFPVYVCCLECCICTVSFLYYNMISALVCDLLPRRVKLSFRQSHCWKGISVMIDDGPCLDWHLGALATRVHGGDHELPHATGSRPNQGFLLFFFDLWRCNSTKSIQVIFTFLLTCGTASQ